MTRAALLVFVSALIATGAIAADEDKGPRNVKYLTGLDRLEMQRTMNFMRASLGVHCDYCHVVTKEDGWQWHRDDKETKVTARKMIAMVQQINQQQFAGRPVVSCFTCHGGHRVPESLPPLPQSPPPFPTPPRAAAAENLPAADAVWSRFTAAVRLSKRPFSRVLVGKRVGSQDEMPLEIQEKGERIRVVVTTPQGALTQVLDGAEGWVSEAGATHSLNADERAHFREIADALTFPPPAPQRGRVTSKENVEGRDAWVLEWTPAPGRTERLSFDVESGLLLRKTTLTDRSIGVVPERIDYLDYRDVSGAKVPATIRTALVDPWTSATRTFTDIRLDAAVDDGVFKRPAPTVVPVK